VVDDGASSSVEQIFLSMVLSFVTLSKPALLVVLPGSLITEWE
jgi:hypothetical protein